MHNIKLISFIVAFFGASSLAAPAVLPGVDYTPRSVRSPSLAPRDPTWAREVFPERRQDNANGGGIAGRSAQDNANGGGIVWERSPQNNANGGGIAGRSPLDSVNGGGVPGKRSVVGSK